MPSLTLLHQSDYLLPQVVSYLTSGWEKGILDLSDTVLVLPTQEASRRLHEALTRKAASRGSVLFPPHWMLPMQLTERDGVNLAPAPLEQLVWMEVISQMSREEARRLFPRKTPQLDTLRASELADAIRSLRGELSQIGKNLQEAEAEREKIGQSDPRWKTLINLEKRSLERITELGFTDRIVAQLEGARNPTLPSGCKRLLIAGVPDLPQVYETMLPLIESQGISVTLLTYDPVDLGVSFFDSLGRPSEKWEEIAIPIQENMIHLSLDRAAEAGKAAALVTASGGSGTISAIGVTGVDLSNSLHDALQAQEIPVFNPAGTSLDRLPIGCLLQYLVTLLREDDFRSLLPFLRHPDVQCWLQLDPTRDLEALDALAAHLIPSSLHDLLERWPEESFPRLSSSNDYPWEILKQSLLSVAAEMRALKTGSGITPILSFLRTLYASVDLTRVAGGKASAERIKSWVSCSNLMLENTSTPEILPLLLSYLQSGVFIGEKKPNSVELPGWLELLWEDAPHLIVAGMNDGLVPEIRGEDPFLSEKLRIAWDLSSDVRRLRCDSYLLHCLLAARAQERGRIDLLLARQDDEGAVLKPSRLLLRCPDDEELPYRVQELFRELPPRPSEKWRAAWALKPQLLHPSLTLSASALKDYLACPTRFYLKHVLKLRSEQFGAEEADSATFGILLHATLREFGSDPKLKNLRDPEEIEKALVTLWRQLFDARYGKYPSFLLSYQREAGVRRLRGAALIQSILRHEGWEIVHCEKSFNNFPFAGYRLNGIIDRIDKRETTAGTEWRIIDYKSSEGEKNPNMEHYRPLGKRDDPKRIASYECFAGEKKEQRWIDLQLPIYRMVFLSENEEVSYDSVEAGYFLLPSKVSEAAFVPFTDLEQHQESAEKCLRGILEAIHQGIFWPPRQPKYDDFQDLFFDHLEADAASGQRTFDPSNLSLSLKQGGAA